jgi:hypothetical protein
MDPTVMSGRVVLSGSAIEWPSGLSGIGQTTPAGHSTTRAGRTNEALDSRRWHVAKAERDDLPLFDTGSATP